MAENSSDSTDISLPVRRLVELLQSLGEKGVNQSQVANRVHVPRQYLSDVVNRRRPLTELFSRSLANEFDFNHLWLMGLEDSFERVVVTAPASSAARAWVPLVDEAIAGDPREHPRWSGACIEICGTAAVRAARAVQPYVLRLGHGDCKNRVRKGDFVLVSQAASDDCELNVVRCGKKIFLARKVSTRWLRADTGDPLRGDCETTGYCVGIIWSALI
jgi:plasmid maintenance system antidote protein VapI